jgi:putative two-component system response regulator
MVEFPTARRVLVVDDEPECSAALSDLLSHAGFAVNTVDNGEAAVLSVRRQPPDMVLLDVDLPGINGFDVCRIIKQDEATRLTPVVLLTGLSGREHRLAGIEAGVRSLTQLKRYTDELESAESLILSLALTVEARDKYTDGHCDRLARYAVALGEKLGLSRDELSALRRGGLLHDVGKIGIPDAVLFKPGRLTRDEYELVKQHTIIGERLCMGLRSLSAVRPIIRQHHERLNGSGYPDGLKGDEINVLAHIIGIVDAYDAMTTARPYRRAQTNAFAIAELRADVQKGELSPELVEPFIAIIEQPAPVPVDERRRDSARGIAALSNPRLTLAQE